MPALKRSRSQRIALADRKKRAFRQKAAFKARLPSYVPRGQTNTGPASGFPDKKTVVMKYVQTTAVLTARKGTPIAVPNYPTLVGDMTPLQAGHQDFRANSPYQPNINLTGNGQAHQPRDWDIYKDLYNHYRVKSSKIKVDFTHSPFNTGGYRHAILCGITRMETPPAANAAVIKAQMLEDPSTRYKVLHHDNDISLTSNYVAKKGYGDQHDLVATTTTNPPEDHSYVIWASENTQDHTGWGSKESWVECVVTIYYTVEFWERKTSQVN